MILIIVLGLLFSSGPYALAAHQVFGEQWAQDERFFPEEDYVTQGIHAETYEEVGDYYPEFAKRVLTQFVLRAEQLGFATRLGHIPPPEQTGVTGIELTPGIITYYDTSRINKAIHAKLIGEDGLHIHWWPHMDDIAGAFQGLLRDEETKQKNALPEPTINPIWYEHFGQP